MSMIRILNSESTQNQASDPDQRKVIHRSSAYKVVKLEVVLREDQEDGGFNVSCPALPGCHSQGENVDEALANIREAIQAYLESLDKDGEAIPTAPAIHMVEIEHQLNA